MTQSIFACLEVRADLDQLENKRKKVTYQMPVLAETINPDKHMEE